jgi:hypothetical protein
VHLIFLPIHFHKICKVDELRVTWFHGISDVICTRCRWVVEISSDSDVTKIR